MEWETALYGTYPTKSERKRSQKPVKKEKMVYYMINTEKVPTRIVFVPGNPGVSDILSLRKINVGARMLRKVVRYETIRKYLGKVSKFGVLKFCQFG